AAAAASFGLQAPERASQTALGPQLASSQGGALKTPIHAMSLPVRLTSFIACAAAAAAAALEALVPATTSPGAALACGASASILPPELPSKILSNSVASARPSSNSFKVGDASAEARPPSARAFCLRLSSAFSFSLEGK